MRLPAIPPLLLAALVATSTGARADTADVVVQAGHQGRPASCKPNHVSPAACKLGAAGSGESEIAWTPLVADDVQAALRARGLTVIRRPADYQAHDTARAAVFLHFDGAATCKSGASVGFPATTSRAFVTGWETRYRAFTGSHVPFSGENISGGERAYYDYKRVTAPNKMVVEFSNMGCPAQVAWMKPRLKAVAGLLAAYLADTLQK